MKPSQNIFFVGLMGAGKTTVGRLLAKQLGYPFYDADHEIEARTGVSIPTIFEHEGENGFRKREAEIIAQLVQQRGIVMATGGGAVSSALTRQLLVRHGTVVYLRAKPEDLYQRTLQDTNRPLLQTADPLGKLRELLAQREPWYYEVADLVIETGSASITALVRQICSALHLDD